MTTVNGQIGTDREGARRYLGCSESMFEEYTARKIVQPVRKNWYFYSDLDRAAEQILKERDARLAQAAKLGGDGQERGSARRSSRVASSQVSVCKTPEEFVRGPRRDPGS